MRRELTLQEFYASDPQRAQSREVRYGTLWREFAPVPAYRLAWVQNTGELYAVELSEPDEGKDPVEVLGVCGAGRTWRPARPAGPSAAASSARWCGREIASAGGARWLRKRSLRRLPSLPASLGPDRLQAT
jgi:hypothetical protein